MGDVAVGARVVRTRWPLSARLRLSIADATAPFPLRRLRVDVENTVTDQDVDAPRAEVLRRSLVATHCLLAVQDGQFLSLLEPPRWAAEAAEECRNLHTFPVLAGAKRASGTWCCRPRSSCTTTPASRRKAPATCSTRARSTRSSRSAR